MKQLYVRFARWLMALLGGVFVGGGLVLHAQVAVWHYMREEVASTFILWRGIGKLTFVFQDEMTKTALLAHDVPPIVLAEADRAAWVLVVIGAVVALFATVVRIPRRARKKAK